MKTSTNIRDIRLTRENAAKQKTKALVTRFEMACPGQYVILHDVPYGRAYRMNLHTQLEVKDQDNWVNVKDHDEDTLYNIYTKYDKEEPVLEQEQIEEEIIEEEPVVEEAPVEEETEEDESDEEEIITSDAQVTEVNEAENKEDETTSTEDAVEENPIEQQQSNYTYNKKNIHYKKKK